MEKFFLACQEKKEEEAYEKITEMSGNNDYTAVYFTKDYRIIATDLIKKTKFKYPKQINFIGRFERLNIKNGTTIFYH